MSLCQLCGSQFKTLKNFSLHLKQHETETPGVFKCLSKNCLQLFQSTSELRQHSDVHTLGKFKCETCGKCFETIHGLSRHVPRHFDALPFRCKVPGCSYAGKLKVDLYLHNHNKHSDAGFTCPLCGKFIKLLVNLKNHLKRHETATPGVYRCTYKFCKHIRFSSTDELKKHCVLSHNCLKTDAVFAAFGILSQQDKEPEIDLKPEQLQIEWIKLFKSLKLCAHILLKINTFLQLEFGVYIPLKFHPHHTYTGI